MLDGTLSNPTQAALPYARAEIAAALGHDDVLTYEPAPLGHGRTREAIVAALGHGDATRVVVTASTSEAYTLLWKVLCDAGDAVLVPAPSYPLFEMLARFEGLRVVTYPLRFDGAWHIDGDALRRIAAETPGARAVITVNPNNPTGHYVSDGDWDALVATGLPVISDEVFLGYAHAGRGSRARSVMERGGATLRFALGGLSKRVGLPQVKLGWILVGGEDPACAEVLARLELVTDAFLSVSASAEVAAPVLLREGEATAEAIRGRVAANLQHLDGAVAGTAMTRLACDGGWYAVLRVPGTRTDEAWALRLLEADGVLVQPGYFYDMPETGTYLVLSLLVPEETFITITQRITARITQEA